MEAKDNPDINVGVHLPHGVKEYLNGYKNEAIATQIFSNKINKIEELQSDLIKENIKTIDKTGPVKIDGGNIQHKKYINERIASVEQPSFKIFGFEFAPLFIPIERRLQVTS